MTCDKFLLSCTALLGLCLSLAPAVVAKEGASIPFHLQQKSPGQRIAPAEFSREVEGLLFSDSNAQRQKKKLAPLEPEAILAKAARDHSQDMLKRNYLSHFSPEGKSVVDRVKKYQPKLQRSLGENLHTISSAQGLVDPKAVATQMMDDWMHSASHRKNILSKDYRYLGIACASDGMRIFCTQVFGGAAAK
ncbi:MAG: CAP domain-containing protein [bacterium]